MYKMKKEKHKQQIDIHFGFPDDFVLILAHYYPIRFIDFHLGGNRGRQGVAGRGRG